jgi:hypothetical protein
MSLLDLLRFIRSSIGVFLKRALRGGIPKAQQTIVHRWVQGKNPRCLVFY